MKSVCILLATYNGEKFIEEQIDSIINQNYNNWYLYISDDGSIDNTMNIIRYKYKHYDNIFIIDNKKLHGGAKNNFNNLIINVPKEYDYYMLCDQDDLWAHNKIEKLLFEISKYDDNIPTLIYSDSALIDENSELIGESLIDYTGKTLPNNNLVNHLLIENFFPGCVTMFNKELFKIIDNIYISAEMHDWWIALVAAINGKIICFKKPLHYYRQHSSNTVGAHRKGIDLRKLLLKIFNLKLTLNCWHEYQTTVKNQTKELIKRYPDSEYIDILKEFYNLMKIKNSFKRFIYLLKNRFYPVNIIRIFRLII